MKKSDLKDLEISPQKSLLGELELLQTRFREVCRAYTREIEGNLATVRARVLATLPAETDSDGAAAPAAPEPDPPASQRKARRAESHHNYPELRDMLMLVRALDVSATSARRKDLKKIETAVTDLCELAKQLR